MWGRALAGVLPGFFLAAALTGLIVWCAPGDWQNAIVPGVVLFPVAWISILGGAFFFANGRRAWSWLGGATVFAFALLAALKSFDWVR